MYLFYNAEGETENMVSRGMNCSKWTSKLGTAYVYQTRWFY